MTRFRIFGWIVIFCLFRPVSCSFTCSSNCTAIDNNVNVTFPCALLEVDELTDPWVPNCGPLRPSPITCDQVHINNEAQMGFSWHPPGDSSAKDIMGFRILIFITNTGNFYPRGSYRMNLTEWNPYVTDPLTTFTLRCLFDEEGDRQYVPVYASVFSLPKSSRKSCIRNASSCEKHFSAPTYEPHRDVTDKNNRLHSKEMTHRTSTVIMVSDTMKMELPPATVPTMTKTGLGIYIGVPVALVLFLVSAILVPRCFLRDKDGDSGVRNSRDLRPHPNIKSRRKTCLVSTTEQNNGHSSSSTTPRESDFTQMTSWDQIKGKQNDNTHTPDGFDNKSTHEKHPSERIRLEPQLQTTNGQVEIDDRKYNSEPSLVCPIHGTPSDIDYIPPLTDQAVQRAEKSLAAFNER